MIRVAASRWDNHPIVPSQAHDPRRRGLPVLGPGETNLPRRRRHEPEDVAALMKGPCLRLPSSRNSWTLLLVGPYRIHVPKRADDKQPVGDCGRRHDHLVERLLAQLQVLGPRFHDKHVAVFAREIQTAVRGNR